MDQSIPWAWIVEHLLKKKDVGPSLLAEMASKVTDIEHNSILQKRVSIRYLEEIIVSRHFDVRIIPLVKSILEDKKGDLNSGHKDIFLRVQTEAVLMHARQKPTNWKSLLQALDDYLPADSKDPDNRSRRKEFLSLLQSSDDESKFDEILDAFPIDLLWCDLLKCITVVKLSLPGTFLCQIAQDVLVGNYPYLECETHAILGGEKLEHGFARDSLGSDDQTVVGRGRNSEVDSEESPDSRNVHAIPSKRPKFDQYSDNRDTSTMLQASIACSLAKDQYTVEPLTVHKECQLEKTCIKCRKPGAILSCAECPVAVHEECLVPTTSSPAEREWHCPICLHKKAADALARAKEEDRSAKEKLALFLKGTDAKEKLITVLSLLSKREENSQRNEDGSCAEIDVLAAKVVSEPSAFEQKEQSKSTFVDLREKKTSSPTQSKAAIQADCCPAACPLKETGKNDEEIGRQTRVLSGGEHLEPLEGYTSEIDEEHRLSASKLRHSKENQSDKAETHVNSGGLGEDKIDGQPDKAERVARTSFRGNRITPGLRRKKLRWSKEEEETLKVGVKKFSHGNGEWGFQWTRILDFGRGSFHPSRTVVDLKDKWRNLSRSPTNVTSSSE